MFMVDLFIIAQTGIDLDVLPQADDSTNQYISIPSNTTKQ